MSRRASSSSDDALIVSPHSLQSITRMWPPFPSGAAGELLLDRGDLGQPAPVALLAGELGAQVDPHDLLGHGGADHAAAQADDVHVVVLDTLVGGVGVVRHGGTDAGELGGGGGDSRAGS